MVGNSEASRRLKKLALEDPDYWQMTFPKIAHDAGIDISRSYSDKIMAEHHDLY